MVPDMTKVFITGANQGIGYYLVEKLLETDNTVGVLDIETNKISKLEERYPKRLVCYQADVSDFKAVRTAVNDFLLRFTAIDTAIHNACLCTFGPEEATDLETYKQVLSVNYLGALHVAKAVLPAMKQQSSGRLIFTSSGVGVTGFTGISPYASSKGAIESLAKCLRLEYQDYGITCHLIHPPLTKTESASGLAVPDQFKADPRKVGYSLAGKIDSKRFIICHSFGQKFQMMLSYFFPLKTGRMMSKMTQRYLDSQAKKQ